MSVIGRLDEQVDSVFIRPLSKRRERDHERDARDDDETPEIVIPSPATTPHDDAPKNKSTRTGRELPVWML